MKKGRGLSPQNLWVYFDSLFFFSHIELAGYSHLGQFDGNEVKPGERSFSLHRFNFSLISTNIQHILLLY